jgi:hypothetical protein
MQRLHLFEFEDLPWFPASLRDMLTDLLGLTIEIAHLYHPVLPQLAAALQTTGDRLILDMCSGGGGPVPGLRRRLARDYGLEVEARLSDIYPNVPAFAHLAAREGSGLTYVPTPIDATQVPPELSGFRTLFSCLHHFQPAQAEAILADAWRRDRGIGVFEITDRSLLGLMQALLGPLSACLLTPLVRPRRLSRLVLTYAVPIVPALFAFDGIVSSLRTYTLDELNAMTRSLQRNDYRWELGQVRHPLLPTRVTYLFGLPQRRGDARAASPNAGGPGEPPAQR